MGSEILVNYGHACECNLSPRAKLRTRVSDFCVGMRVVFNFNMSREKQSLFSECCISGWTLAVDWKSFINDGA